MYFLYDSISEELDFLPLCHFISRFKSIRPFFKSLATLQITCLRFFWKLTLSIYFSTSAFTFRPFRLTIRHPQVCVSASLSVTLSVCLYLPYSLLLYLIFFASRPTGFSQFSTKKKTAEKMIKQEKNFFSGRVFSLRQIMHDEKKQVWL